MVLSKISAILLIFNLINCMSDAKQTKLSNIPDKPSPLELLPEELKEHIIYGALFDNFHQNLILIKNIQLTSHIFYSLITCLTKQKKFIRNMISQSSTTGNSSCISDLAKLGTSGAIDYIQDELRRNPSTCNNLLYNLCSAEKIDRLSFKMLISILKAGIDVNTREDFHDYPLIEAINKNNFQIVKTLLKFNANPCIEDIFSENIFFLCIFTANPKIIALISFAQIYARLKKLVNYSTKLNISQIKKFDKI